MLLPIKTNLCATPPGLGFTIENQVIRWEDEPVALTAEQFLAESAEQARFQREVYESELSRVTAWLKSRLSGGKVYSSTLREEAVGGGYVTDAETGWLYCTFRYYDPNTGRWLNRDPAGYAGGVNLYAYCGQNPIMGSDPLGLAPFGLSDSSYAGQSLNFLGGEIEGFDDHLVSSLSFGLLGGRDMHCASEAERDGFPIPAKCRAQRFHKNRKSVNEQRAEPRHHAEARRQHHAPTVITEIKFGQLGGRFGIPRFKLVRKGNRHFVKALYRRRRAGPITQKH